MIAVAIVAGALLCAAAAHAEEPVRAAVTDAVLDRNGDGFQDVIVKDRILHYDVDFDGHFDFSLSMAFKQYSSEGHRRYLESGFAPAVFAELTLAGLDELCASEQIAHQWTKRNFASFGYYRDGYGRLSLFDTSAENDGRLASPKSRPRYDVVATFNPDGTVHTVERGGRTATLAEFDYQTNTSSGSKVFLPKIAGKEDLAAVRAALESALPAPPLQ